MKNKFVLGIVAVLCLQIFFQVFLALERADERYFRVKGSTPLAKPIEQAVLEPEIASLTEDYTFADTTNPRRTAAKRLVERTASTPQFAVARIERRRLLPPQLSAVAAISPVQQPKDVILPVQAEVRARGRRSFIARALPVIKKPYDFFKFVGSKLK